MALRGQAAVMGVFLGVGGDLVLDDAGTTMPASAGGLHTNGKNPLPCLQGARPEIS